MAVGWGPTAVVDDVSRGVGRVEFIQGGIGTGKTRALDGVVRCAEEAGIAVVRSSLRAADQTINHNLVRDLVVGESALARAGLDDATRHSPGSIADEILSRHGAAPTLIAVDDLHWADQASLTVLVDVCRRARRFPLGIVATLRPWPEVAARDVAALVRAGDAFLQLFGRMTKAESTALLTARLTSTLGAEAVDALVALAGGNVLLLTMMATVLASADDDVKGVDDIVPILAARLGPVADVLDIDATAQTCLEAASVLGDRFRAELALDVAQIVPDELGHIALDALCRLGVLGQGPGRTLEFAQPLIQLLLYRDMTPPVRMMLHRRAFTALARRGFEQRAAEHATRANLSGSVEAIDLLARVGHAALRDGATRRAAESFRAALELASDHATPDLHVALALALLRSGQPVAAARTLERMLRDVNAESATRVRALRMLGQALTAAGRRSTAATHFRHAATVADETAPGAAADMRIDGALVAIRLGQLHNARAFIDRALRDAPNDADLRDTTLCDAVLRALEGHVDAIPQVEELALTLLFGPLTAAENEERLPELATLCGLVLAATGRLTECDGFLAAALEMARRDVPGGAIAGLLACRADVKRRLGHLAAAETLAVEAVAASTGAPGDGPLALAIQGRVLLDLGRIDDCRDACAKAESLLDAREDAFAGLWLRSVRAALSLHSGDIQEAAELHFAIAERVESTGLCLPGLVGWELLAVVSLSRTDQLDAVQALVNRHEAAGALPVHRWAAVVAALGQGVLAERRGAVNAAAEQLRRAADLAEGLPGAGDRAATAWLLGAFLRRNGWDVEARRVLGGALQTAKSVGAMTLAGMITDELGVATGRVRRRRTAPGELTAQELRVVELAGEGRTNREIAAHLWISVNTVETHLRHAFAKLGVSTRTQLASRLAASESELVPA